MIDMIIYSNPGNPPPKKNRQQTHTSLYRCFMHVFISQIYFNRDAKMYLCTLHLLHLWHLQGRQGTGRDVLRSFRGDLDGHRSHANLRAMPTPNANPTPKEIAGLTKAVIQQTQL